MKKVLLTWDSYNHGFVVVAKVLELLHQNHDIEIDEIYYLQNNNLSEQNLAEKSLFYKEARINELFDKFKNSTNFESKIKFRFEEVKRIRYTLERDKVRFPKFNQKRIHLKNVTHYQSIYDELREFIKLFYNQEVELHINVSPGTPQMHVVWLMLNSSGFLPSNTVLWSSQWNKDQKETQLSKINFKPKTFLSEVFEKKYYKNHEVKINPNETKSLKRKEVEDRLLLFSRVPKAPILVLGERGTGKSTYVRSLVKQKNEQICELACGTFTNDMMRAELFGFKKGSFTGAVEDKKGFLSKLKDGGVLFLDEIQDLSKELQRQLMQVLQTGNYYPIGATEVEHSNFRLVTASNLSYNELLTKLDLDFLDRVARFVVKVPSVRESLEDIESYWRATWNLVADFEGAPSLIWSDDLDTFIRKQTLNGNFRDLQKLASYVLAFYLSSKNKKEAIKKAVLEFESINRLNEHSDKYFQKGKSHKEIMANFEKDIAEWAINEYGSKKGASEILNVSESSITKFLSEDRLKRK